LFGSRRRSPAIEVALNSRITGLGGAHSIEHLTHAPALDRLPVQAIVGPIEAVGDLRVQRRQVLSLERLGILFRQARSFPTVIRIDGQPKAISHVR
jgi:hypothetical protein